MRYPFLYQVIGHLDVSQIRNTLVIAGEEARPFAAEQHWSLTKIKSAYLEQYIKEKFISMELFGGYCLLSRSKTGQFHNDMGDTKDLLYTLTHRILVPLTNNYYYEWDVNGVRTVFRPNPGDVILFNNCEVHRYVLDEGHESREAIVMNLVDKDLLPLLQSMSK